jgi:tetratricopeptide (TPR) repeat protein
MSAATLAQEGMKAIHNKDYDVAINKLTKALKAWVGKNDFERALRDADAALLAATTRSKRDLMTEAHYRRAVAYFRLKQYANASCCCVWAQSLLEGNLAAWDKVKECGMLDKNGNYKIVKDKSVANMFKDKDALPNHNANAYGEVTETSKVWNQAFALRVQSHSALTDLSDKDPSWKVTAKMVPDKSVFVDEEDMPGPQVVPKLAHTGDPKDTVHMLAKDKDAPKRHGEPVKIPTSNTDKSDFEMASRQASTAAYPTTRIDGIDPTLEDKLKTQPAVAEWRRENEKVDTSLRLDHYQTADTITVSLFQKGVSKERLIVDFYPRKVGALSNFTCLTV